MMKDKGYSAQMKQPGGLSRVVELEVGCKVIITTNIDTDMDMSNGAQGQVVHIWVDPQEPAGNGESSVEDMQYPPACVLVKMEQF